MANKLSISLSTAHLLTKEVLLSEEQIQKLTDLHRQSLIQGRDKFIKLRKTQKNKLESEIFAEAKDEVQKRRLDTFFIMGLALYWAEGLKRIILWGLLIRIIAN